MDLIEFLRARYDEDEAMALAANGPRWASGDGNVSEGGLYALQGEGVDGWSIAWFELGTANEAADGSRQLPRWPKMERHAHQNSVHAARHDPARVLAEVAAHRRIVEDATAHETCGGGYDECAEASGLTLRHLASVYADHPDYDPKWAPGS